MLVMTDGKFTAAQPGRDRINRIFQDYRESLPARGFRRILKNPVNPVHCRFILPANLTLPRRRLNRSASAQPACGQSGFNHALS
jgi:hypothetical protein